MKVLVVLSLFVFAACSKIDHSLETMDQMKESVKQTNAGMDNMQVGLHDQTLAVTLSEMMKPENTKNLSPLPAAMIPWGKKFAEKAYSDELVQLVYILMTDINETSPDEAFRDSTTHEWRADYAAAFDHDKQAKLWAAMIVSGFAPQATIDQLIKTEIDGEGRYEDSAKTLLALRYTFVNTVLIGADLLEKPMDNYGKLSVAAERADQVQAIANLPYVASLQAKISGMLTADNNVTISVDPADAVQTWRQIDSKMDSDYVPSHGGGGTGDQKSTLPPQAQALRERIRSHIPADSSQN